MTNADSRPDQVLSAEDEAQLRGMLGECFDTLRPDLRRMCRGYRSVVLSKSDNEVVAFVGAAKQFVDAWNHLSPERRKLIWALAGGQPIGSRSIDAAIPVLTDIIAHQDSGNRVRRPGRPPETERYAFLDSLARLLGGAGFRLTKTRTDTFTAVAGLLWARITGQQVVGDLYRAIADAVDAYRCYPQTLEVTTLPPRRRRKGAAPKGSVAKPRATKS